MSMTTQSQVMDLTSDRSKNAQLSATLVLGFLLLEGALWTPRPFQTALGFVTLAYVVLSVVRRRHSAEEVGFSRRSLLRGWWTLPAALSLSGFMILVAWWAGTLHVVTHGRAMVAGSVLYLVWALEQEFMLQGFFYLGLKRLAGERWAIVSAAFLFAFAHLPNPVLTVATLLGGLFFTAIFAQYRNLLVVAFLHAILGITLAMTAPDSVNHHMRVGLGYLRYHVGIVPERPPIPVEPRRASLVGGDQLR